ncbi:MAG: mannosyltransferase family protein [Sphaerobacter sp.]|nr:mannosyltransferase family protein [Sphaerobacter sp.]
MTDTTGAPAGADRNACALRSPRAATLAAVATAFGISRIAFYASAALGLAILPPALEPARVEVGGPAALALHWRWDAVYYYHIAVEGYPWLGLTAFFPVLPVLLWLGATGLGGLQPPSPLPIADASPAALIAGVLVAHAATLLALWLLYRLAEHETQDPKVAARATRYAAVFPLAFISNTPHTEATFLAVSVGAFLAARRGRWISAGLWAAVASATRPLGVLVAPALMVELIAAYRRRQPSRRELFRAAVGVALSPIGLLGYMAYLWQRYGDPLAFVHVHETEWHHDRLLPIQTLYRGIRFALHPDWSNTPAIWAVGVVHLVVVLAFGLILLASWRSWPASYLVYGALLFTMVLSMPLPGAWTMHSMGRYVMVLFPVYLSLGKWGHRPFVHHAILGVCLPLFGLFSALHTNWYPT